MNPAPPSSPAPADAASPDRQMVRTYIRTGVLFLPTFLGWSFSIAFLLPKIQQFWTEEKLAGTSAQAVMDLSSLFFHVFSWLVAAVPIAVIVFEFRWPEWPQYRRTAMTIIVAIFHAILLASILSLAIAVCLAVPLLAKSV